MPMTAPGGAGSIRLCAVSSENVDHIKLLNTVVFPIKYPDIVYKQCAAYGDVSLLAYQDEELLGGIGCRLEAQVDGTAKLYIMTLAVLAPCRGKGIGSTLLQQSLRNCSEDPNITEAYLHVQAINEEAIRFYSRLGFQVAETVPGYYGRRMDPPDAVVLRRRLSPKPEAAAAAAGVNS